MIADTRPVVVRLVIRCDDGANEEDERPQCLKQATVFVCHGEAVIHPLQDIGWGVMGNSHYCPEHSNW
jgi:hypothetical protein